MLLITLPTQWVGVPPSWRGVKGCNVLLVFAEPPLRQAFHVLMSAPPLPASPPDLKAGTVDDTLSARQLAALMLLMLGSKVATAARETWMALWMAVTITRGNDARLVFLADLLAPACISIIGEALGRGWAGKCP
jgi:hypothetical protein